MWKDWQNSLKNIVHEKPKVYRSDNSPVTSLSQSLLLVLKSGETFIGCYEEVNGKDVFCIYTGRCSLTRVPDENPVIFWKYLEGFPMLMYHCNCEGYDKRRNDGFSSMVKSSHVVGTFGCLYKIVYQDEEPRSSIKGSWLLNGKEISNKRLFEDLGYSFRDGCWRRLKTKEELKSEDIYYQKYIKENPIYKSFEIAIKENKK